MSKLFDKSRDMTVFEENMNIASDEEEFNPFRGGEIYFSGSSSKTANVI